MDVLEVMERIKQEIDTVQLHIQVDNGSERSTPDLSPKLWICRPVSTKSRWISPDHENQQIMLILSGPRRAAHLGPL
ncbi:hypothetical protein D770_21990 [Flammeovirgaceae bacterium 311]|nr:hypothetical protein D770_21990 [Flammeovirgaceae bacterium 311]